MRDFVNNKVNELKPSGIRKFFDLVASSKENIISLGVGEPDFITPWEIRNAGVSAIQKGYTQYTSNSGLPALRENISKYLKQSFKVDYKADEIILTIGASEGIDLTLRTVIEDGDEVLIPDPSYVSYAPCVTLSGGNPVAIKCKAENGFKLTPEMLEEVITPKTKVLIFPYPNNPTGGIMEREYIEKIIPVIKKHDLLVLSDEIYAELTYGDKHVSIAEFDGMAERTVIVSGFSKAFAMTGWRIGYLCAKNPLLKNILKIHQYTAICAPIMSQYAALTGLQEGMTDGFSVVKSMRDEYDRRRRFMYECFTAMGLKCFEPKGAFYIMPSVESLNMTGEEFAEKLLLEEKVAVVPGSAFGESGENFIRCTYATSMKNLIEATKRIKNFVDRRKK